MQCNSSNRIWISVVLAVLIFLAMGAFAWGRGDVIPFDSDKWQLQNAKVTEFLGRKCLSGGAFLKDTQFQNGVIEVDIAVKRARSYPGLVFRVQPGGNYEHIYIRPHRTGFYPDSLQYAPTIKQVSGWQLYSGPGFTRMVSVPYEKWVHLRLEVKGNRARVFVGEDKEPALEIDELQLPIAKGGIGVAGPNNGTAYFSNFSFREDNNLTFPPPRFLSEAAGMLRDWQLSSIFKTVALDREQYPEKAFLDTLTWQGVRPDRRGLVDISRYAGRSRGGPDCVLAKTIIKSERDAVKKIQLGYSDEVHVYLNGRLLFSGDSAYRRRDPSFVGVVGLFDALYLPLKKGDNQLMFIVSETFGGWGFMCRDTDTEFTAAGIKKVWETSKQFAVPECTAYDPENNALYVSNFDQYNYAPMAPAQYISKLTPEGKIVNIKWVTGVSNPTGMAVYKGKLFVVERFAVLEIDTKAGKIVKRHPIPKPIFLNDIAIDPANGDMYVSDSNQHVIFKAGGGQWETWLTGKETGIRQPNGLHLYAGKLYIGNNGDTSIKVANLADKKVTTLVRLEKGIIDGIRNDRQGNLLVSQWDGRVYRISPGGDVSLLLNTMPLGLNTADFEYIAEKGLMVFPNFFQNKVSAYKIEK